MKQFFGCLFGAAVGDAIGAPVELLSLSQIRVKYGIKGVNDFYPWKVFPAGSYTDDTQMTLATVEGLVEADQQCDKEDIDCTVKTVSSTTLNGFS